MSNLQYVSLPKRLPLSDLRPSDLGLYALVCSLSTLPEKYHFTVSGLSSFAMGECSTVRASLKRLSAAGVLSVNRLKPTSSEMELFPVEGDEGKTRTWNGFLYRKDLSLEAKGVCIGMQLAGIISARELCKKIKASRSTIQRYQKELSEKHVLLFVGSRNDDGRFAFNDAILLGSDGHPSVRLIRSVSKKRSSFYPCRASKTVAHFCEGNKDLDLKSFKTFFKKDNTDIIHHKINAFGSKMIDDAFTAENRKQKIKDRFCSQLPLDEINFFLREEGVNGYTPVSQEEYENILTMLTERYCSVYPLRVYGNFMSVDSMREILNKTNAESVGTAIANICRFGKSIRNERNYFLVSVIRQTQLRSYRERMIERDVAMTNGLKFSAVEYYGSREKKSPANRFENFSQREYSQEFYKQIEIAMRKRRWNVG